jgi:hypothetical protein
MLKMVTLSSIFFAGWGGVWVVLPVTKQKESKPRKPMRTIAGHSICFMHLQVKKIGLWQRHAGVFLGRQTLAFKVWLSLLQQVCSCKFACWSFSQQLEFACRLAGWLACSP